MTRLHIGDVITFSARPKWWMRLAIWLRIVKPKPPRQFVVTTTTASSAPELQAAVERVTAWCALIERPPHDSLAVDADVAAEHAADLRLILAALEARGKALEALEALRAAGWSVAVHNDYRLNGEPHTFWLFTHPDGRWVKGEGRTDDEALTRALTALGGTADV